MWTLYHRKVLMAKERKGKRSFDSEPLDIDKILRGDSPQSNDTADNEEAAAVEVKKTVRAKKPKRAFTHSSKYRAAAELVDPKKAYSLTTAIDLAKKVSYTKFDGTLSLHVKLNPIKKNDENVRGTVTLPHGTGKERNVIIVTDELIEKIEKGWTDFDIAIATPDMMPKLAKLAKILGPKGLMPNPKSGTVTTDPEKTAQELKGGKVEFKSDSLNNIHQTIGKLSWDSAKLLENYAIFVNALPKGRIKSITIAPTMGPGIKVQI